MRTSYNSHDVNLSSEPHRCFLNQKEASHDFEIPTLPVCQQSNQTRKLTTTNQFRLQKNSRFVMVVFGGCQYLVVLTAVDFLKSRNRFYSLRCAYGMFHELWTSQWCHNECDGVSNHQPHECLFKAQIKENIKAPCHWPLWGEFTGDRWIPRTNGQ